jgi:hypothetical protein
LNKYGIEIQQLSTGDIESGSLTGVCTRSCGLNQLTKHAKRAPGELDMGSMCKQPTDKHCNLDQGQIKFTKKIQAQDDPWVQPAHKQAQSGHEYVNPTYVGQVH